MKTVIASHWTTDGDRREHRPSAVLARGGTEREVKLISKPVVPEWAAGFALINLTNGDLVQTQISSILLQILHYFKCRFIILMKDSLTPLSLMLWKFPNNEDNHSHVVFPVSIGLVI